MPSNDHMNPFRVAFRRYGEDRSPVADHATEQDGWQTNDREGLPVSSLRAMLQGQEVTAPAHHGGVRQGAHAQMSLLPAPQQVQDQHIEARHAYSSESTVSVAALIIDWWTNSLLFFIYLPDRRFHAESMPKTMQLLKSMILSNYHYFVPRFLVRYMSLLYCNIILFCCWNQLIDVTFWYPFSYIFFGSLCYITKCGPITSSDMYFFF